MLSGMRTYGRSLLKGRADLAAAALFGALSYGAAGSGRAIWPYLDWRLLSLLFCLMIVTGGLRQCGVLERLCFLFLRHCHTAREISLFFTGAAFFSSMVITNDAALLVFVPETILVLWRSGRRDWIAPAVVWETIAANLGSMLFPMGNPQNLFLYFHYHMEFLPFLRLTLPYTALALLLILGAAWCRKNEPAKAGIEKKPVQRKGAAFLTVLFLVIVLAVLRLIPWEGALLLTILAVWRRPALLGGADSHLLLLFAFLFIGVGNLQHVPFLSETIRSFTEGHELAAAVLLSQVISNVPAAVLLSGYTGNAEALVAGTDIGGLGTLIASMASLISFRLCSKVPGLAMGRYLLLFTGWNLVFLTALYGLALILE